MIVMIFDEIRNHSNHKNQINHSSDNRINHSSDTFNYYTEGGIL